MSSLCPNVHYMPNIEEATLIYDKYSLSFSRLQPAAYSSILRTHGMLTFSGQICYVHLIVSARYMSADIKNCVFNAYIGNIVSN